MTLQPSSSFSRGSSGPHGSSSSRMDVDLVQLHCRANPPFSLWMEHYHKLLAADRRHCVPENLWASQMCIVEIHLLPQQCESHPRSPWLAPLCNLLDFWALKGRPWKCVQSGRTSLNHGGERCQKHSAAMHQAVCFNWIVVACGRLRNEWALLFRRLIVSFKCFACFGLCYWERWLSFTFTSKTSLLLKQHWSFRLSSLTYSYLKMQICNL